MQMQIGRHDNNKTKIIKQLFARANKHTNFPFNNRIFYIYSITRSYIQFVLIALVCTLRFAFSLYLYSIQTDTDTAHDGRSQFHLWISIGVFVK